MDCKNSKSRKNTDANCRLRHGLNVHCLAEIFQYLNSPDLYTVGEMNDFYKQIINDLVISNHKVDFRDLKERGIEIAHVFERYGTKIQKINFMCFDTCEHFMEVITQYCSADQLKEFRMDCGCTGIEPLDLTIQFRKVDKLYYHGRRPLSTQNLESLRYLELSQPIMAQMQPNFQWTKLMNLTELYLKHQSGINVQNFIDFLRNRPNLEVFHHDRWTFGNFTQVVCEALAEFCGSQIRDYFGVMPDGKTNKHDFISGLKNVKKVFLEVSHGGDIFDPVKRLAENDTVESLTIIYWGCGFDIENLIYGFDKEKDLPYPLPYMRHFSHLRTFRYAELSVGSFRFFNLLNLYGFQILSNVENLVIISYPRNWEFIKFALKLHHLEIEFNYINSYDATAILLILKYILQTRNSGHTRDDSIELKVDERDLEKFAKNIEYSDSIRISIF